MVRFHNPILLEACALHYNYQLLNRNGRSANEVKNGVHEVWVNIGDNIGVRGQVPVRIPAIITSG